MPDYPQLTNILWETLSYPQDTVVQNLTQLCHLPVIPVSEEEINPSSSY